MTLRLETLSTISRGSEESLDVQQLRSDAISKSDPKGDGIMKRLILLLLIGSTAFGGKLTTAQTSSDAATILRASLSALSGQTLTRDVTIVGTAERVAGSEDETGSFTFKALSSGSSRIQIDLSSGTLTDNRQVSSSGRSGSWSSGDGIQHQMAGHNLMVDSTWCFPAFILQRLLTDRDAVTSIGLEGTLVHLQSYEIAPSGWPQAATDLNRRMTQIDLYLDPATFLPARIRFNIHPDNNALIDIPVSIEFSSYQSIGGAVVPMHVVKYVNNTLALDARMQHVSLNTGLSLSEFAAQ
jgi:hypothetical protein